MIQTASADTRVDLSSIHGFSMADLEANARGVLSESQRGGLRKEMLKGTAAFAFAIIWTGMAVVGHSGLFVVIGGIFCLVAAARLVALISDSIGGQVQVVDGDARAESDGDDETPSYTLVIGDLRLKTTSEVYRKWVPGGPYRVYYGPGSKHVVSAYALDGWTAIEATAAPKRRKLPFGLELGG